jgi:hypothetical protein
MKTRANKVLLILVITLLAGSLVGYIWFQARDYIRGASLSITSPQDGQTLSDQFTVISGNAYGASFLRLNGKQIYIDESNHFSESLLVPEGYTIMTIEAEDRFGRTISKELHLLYPKTNS